MVNGNLEAMTRPTASEQSRQIGARLKLLRQAFEGDDWGAQVRFARRVGINPPTWANYESGRSPGRRDFVERIAERSGVDIMWVYYGRPDGVTVRTRELLDAALKRREEAARNNADGPTDRRRAGKPKARRA